jgi:hypothetical protein
VTEAEWLACTNPRKMLEKVKWDGCLASERRLRLFVCAASRYIWPLLVDSRSRDAVEVSERHADGLATREELFAAKESAKAACGLLEAELEVGGWNNQEASDRCEAAAIAMLSAIDFDGSDPVNDLVGRLREGALRIDFSRRSSGVDLASILLELFGNPFRPVALDPTWLDWSGGTVPKLAQAIYDERRFGDMPILADALEEAGCDNADVLAHCRSSGEHVRGCWVLDLLLGKE